MDAVAIEKPPKAGSNWWKQAIAFCLAAALLYFSFRGCDFAAIWVYAKTANPTFILLICLSGLISHVLRAWRWIYLLEPIEHRKVSLWNSFCAVIIGYAVNVPLPRGGEVARLVSISRSEKLPWAGVLPTMLIDRMLDLVVLGILLGVTLTSLPKALLTKELMTGGAALTVCSIMGLIILPWSGSLLRMILQNKMVAERLPEKISTKLGELAGQFEVGTKSLTDKTTWPMIALLTPAIWVFYWLNMYLMVCALNLQSQVSPMQTLVVFTIGSMGVLVPAPGSVGTYHLAVKTGLMAVAGINENLSLAYVSVLHLISFILVPCVTAAVCLAIQSAKTRSAGS
jgi:uncharacterized protein (TIRG00374 family)